ncbi:MAG: hypothetical protein RLZZ214_4153 [Verrucomicrobiota bacterium]|jgi:uncharacterized membrane protein YdjX (TVP38/TMEM64 family)
MRLALWFLGLAALVLGTWLFWGGGWNERFTLAGSVKWLESAGPWAWAAGIGLLAGDLFLPVPSTVVISALGLIYGVLLGGMVAAAGLMTAGLFGYGVGRLFGESFARRWLGGRDYEKGKLLFAAGGGWVVAMSRALPILPEVVSCTAGLVRMPFRRFVLSLACGSLPMGFLFAAIGQTGREAPALAFGLSLAVPAVLWLAASRILR